MLPLVDLSAVSKQYESLSDWVLKDFSFQLLENECVAVMGQSGQGKTTLLNIVGLLDTQFTGGYRLAGRCTLSLSSKERAAFRNQIFGYVFQSACLIPHLSIADNIGLPLVYRGLSRITIQHQVMGLLEQFNLKHLAKRLPSALSGGQSQRISILRALIHRPKCIIADEPTSHLDETTQAAVLKHVMAYQVESKCSVLLVTHHVEVAQSCDRIVNL